MAVCSFDTAIAAAVTTAPPAPSEPIATATIVRRTDGKACTSFDDDVKAGIGLDKVKTHSRHAAIGTLLIYADEHDREGTNSGRSRILSRAS